MRKFTTLPTHAEIVRNAWNILGDYLPTDWEESTHQGWVDTRSRAGITIHPPRNRETVGQRAVAWFLGQKPEEYVHALRFATRGVLPHNRQFIKNLDVLDRKLLTMPAVLSVRDEIFTPLNPDDGNWGHIFAASMIYRVGAGVDLQNRNYTYGLQFRFLHTPDDPGFPNPEMTIGFQTDYRMYNTQQPVLDHLARYGFREPHLPYPNQAGRMSAIMQQCIANALMAPTPAEAAAAQQGNLR